VFYLRRSVPAATAYQHYSLVPNGSVSFGTYNPVRHFLRVGGETNWLRKPKATGQNLEVVSRAESVRSVDEGQEKLMPVTEATAAQ